MDAEKDTVPFVDLRAHHRDLKDQLMEVMSQALDDGAFVGGKALAAFEAEFGKFVGAPYAVGVANGTDALRLALFALGVGPGDAVITVPNTFVATAEAVSQVGGIIELVDVHADTCLMDADRLEEHIRLRSTAARLAAVIPVHLYGQCVDMDAVGTLARRHDFRLLEDAAQAHGADFKGRRAGTLGDAAAFSFYPVKNLGACGEAGAVTTTDREVAERVAMFRDHGQKEKHVHREVGGNSRLDAIQAVFLRVKLGHVEEWNAMRRELAATYDEAFAGIDGVRPVHVSPNGTPSRHLYVIHVGDRMGLAQFLLERGITSAFHYPTPLHLQPCYAALGYAEGAFPNAERSARELISLPLYPEMTREQLKRVIAAVRDWADTSR